MPRVSVILPVHNGARFVERAIRSVGQQIFSDWELIVVDDGSTDATPEIVRSLGKQDRRIRYVRNQENLGIQKSLNRGLSEARGEYVARIDDDDWWEDTGKLEKQVELLDSHPEVALVGTGTVVVDEEGKEIFRFLQPETDAAIRRKILFKNCFTHSSVMFRRDVVLGYGGYDESPQAKHVEDYDLWLKLGAKWKMANLLAYSVRFTLRPRNISSRNKLEQLQKDIELVKKHGESYPCSRWAIAFARLRYALYQIFPIVPFRETFLGWYKRF